MTIHAEPIGQSTGGRIRSFDLTETAMPLALTVSFKETGGSMATYKVDGAKFKSEQELLDSLWPLYQNRMSREEFEKYVKENIVITE